MLIVLGIACHVSALISQLPIRPRFRRMPFRIKTNKMNRRIGQIILAIVVAVSVAILPAAVGFAAGAKTAAVVTVSETMADCDHHHHNKAPSGKTQKTTDKGACMAACAVACFGFTAIGFSGIAFSLPMSTALKFIRTSDNISARMGNLPFRPPRC